MVYVRVLCIFEFPVNHIFVFTLVQLDRCLTVQTVPRGNSGGLLLAVIRWSDSGQVLKRMINTAV